MSWRGASASCWTVADAPAPKRLVAIDDEPAMTAFIARVAAGLGFEVFATADPEAFKAKVEQWRPDCVVLDIVMPEADGIELIGFLAAQDFRGTIVAISGFSPLYLDVARNIGDSRQLAAIRTLTKPIRVEDLRRALQAA